MRPTGQIPFSLQSVNRQRLTDGYVPPAISGQWLIDELGVIAYERPLRACGREVPHFVFVDGLPG